MYCCTHHTIPTHINHATPRRNSNPISSLHFISLLLTSLFWKCFSDFLLLLLFILSFPFFFTFSYGFHFHVFFFFYLLFILFLCYCRHACINVDIFHSLYRWLFVFFFFCSRKLVIGRVGTFVRCKNCSLNIKMYCCEIFSPFLLLHNFFSKNRLPQFKGISYNLKR